MLARRHDAVCQEKTHAPQQRGCSLDLLVGAREKRRRDGEAERLGRLEVDDQFVSGLRQHRKVGWFLALEDAIHVSSRTPILGSDLCDSHTTIKAPAWVASKTRPAVERVRAGT